MRGTITATIWRIRAVADLLYVFSRVLIAAGIAGIVAMVAWQVFTRYWLNASAVWTTEVSTFLMIWMIYIGASMAVRDRDMVMITLLTDRLSPKLRRYCRLLSNVLLMVFLLGMIYLNQEVLVLSSTTPMPVLRISKIWTHLALTTGFAMAAFYALIDSIETCLADPTSDSEHGT